jgi:cytochrome c2
LDFYPRILILALLFVALLCTSAEAEAPGCLGCHPAHYAERGKCVSCHRGEYRTDRRRVAHDGLIPGRFAWFTIEGSEPVARGKKLLETFACRRCHTTGGKGNRLAADLDGLLVTREPREIARAIGLPVQYMPDFRLAERETTDLVNAVLAGGSPVAGKKRETPLVVHFEDERQQEENPFVKHCGPCHKALSEGHGGLGKGTIAPNLSGLFTGFYPATFRDREPWSAEKLQKWLENPRRLRANARMQPVPLKDGDFERLLDTLRVTPATPAKGVL